MNWLLQHVLEIVGAVIVLGFLGILAFCWWGWREFNRWVDSGGSQTLD